MKIGKYDIKLTKGNVRSFFIPYTAYLTYSILFLTERSNIEHFKNALLMGFIPFIVEFIIINYYRNNLHKRKDNWFWSGYKEEGKN